MAHVNTKSGATYTFIHKFNEPYLPSLPSHRVSQPFWTVLISHPTESRRLRWPGGLFTYRDSTPTKQNGHLYQY